MTPKHPKSCKNCEAYSNGCMLRFPVEPLKESEFVEVEYRYYTKHGYRAKWGDYTVVCKPKYGCPKPTTQKAYRRFFNILYKLPYYYHGELKTEEDVVETMHSL